MEMSASIVKVSEALVQAQTEMKNPYNSANNPFFKSKYAPLDAILALVRPILAKNNLLVLQNVGGDGNCVTVTTTILHSSGEYLTSDGFILHPTKCDPQGLGSAATYGRRYSLTAMLGIAGDSDDDANSVSVTPTKASAPKPSTGPVCPTCKTVGTFLRDSEFEGEPVTMNRCGTCKAIFRLKMVN